MSKKYMPHLFASLFALAAALGLYFMAASHPGVDRLRLDSAMGPVDLASFRGKVLLLYFGYTHCPDICPTTLSRVAATFRRLPPGSPVAALFVSVDPNRDSPEHLAEYAHYFHPSVTGATASSETIRALTEHYGAVYREVDVPSANGYVVDHSADTYLLDRNGRLVKVLHHPLDPDATASLIEKLLPPNDRKKESP